MGKPRNISKLVHRREDPGEEWEEWEDWANLVPRILYLPFSRSGQKFNRETRCGFNTNFILIFLTIFFFIGVIGRFYFTRETDTNN